MRITIVEAKRCGMDEQELIEYLEVPWISREEHLELVERLGLSVNRGKRCSAN
jgi:hypothetical protein